MTVISSKEFVINENKYFDLAINEDICIKKDSNLFHLVYIPSGTSKSRQGWAKTAKEFVASGNEESFFPDFFEKEDLSWWQWEQK